MKKQLICITIVIGCLSTMLSSCKKDFLNKQPLDALSSETFWKSDNDVQMALAGVYRRLQSGFYSQYKVWLDTYSDNALDRFSYFGFDQLTQGIVNPTSVTGTFYTSPYQGISACNYFLDNVGKAPITDAVKTSYSAEVRFLRAFYYFDLVQAFGGVVVYKTTPASVAVSKVRQTSRDSVLAFVKEDLDYAIANLPDESYKGHAVKGSAQALEARVALFQRNWSLATTLTQAIMSSGKFSIANDYQGLFLTASQQGSPEIMFSTKYLSPNNYQGDYSGFDIEVGFYGAVAPYQNLVDEYEMKNGKMIGDAGSGFDPASPYVNRDPRLKFTVQVPGDPFLNPDGTVFNHSDPLLTGFGVKKYADVSRLPWNYGKANLTDQNVVHIRYADVLLMYAEAKNEATGPDASVYQALNAVRGRPGVGMPVVDVIKYATQASLRDFIRHERRVELALEGHRYYDLKRWNIMQTRLALIKNPGGVQLKFGEKNNVLPFPQFEMDRNGALQQNDY